MTKLIKNYEGNWTVWNRKNGECADIHTTDYMFMGNHSNRYTVVFRGQRVAIGVEHFQTARGIATKYVKE